MMNEQPPPSRNDAAALILLVEDEQAIADTVIYALEREGFAVRHCHLGRDALAALSAQQPDLILLDIGLPDANGFDLCRKLRGITQAPVIFLTARNHEIDRVAGLEMGADDYIVKPFSPRELTARVRVVLRRTVRQLQAESLPVSVLASSVNSIKLGAFEFDADAMRISCAGKVLDLTRYEYQLLKAMLERPGAILSRAQLMEKVWQDALDSADRTVDTHIKTLRAKLRSAAPELDPIRTHRGLGYSITP
ncbi:two-component system response regulator CreB [Undibacterium terreum]|uniref:DNA-binding response regulator n=1 Tax=Undibacterium terreum TaxID=1224302 RepID=A0A916XAZ8_9BURK|nr:two-component system response regulator CreB [Undibacterium terreum]GGC58462.1 DNA-binding response regulator [Undibacterium terreum]